MKVTFRLIAFFLTLVFLVGASAFSGPAAMRLASAATLSATESGIFPRTVKDGAGNDVTLKAKPVRIVSVALVSDEVLLAMVDHSRIASVTANALDSTQSNVTDIAKTIPNQLAKADPESIVALKPDLVIISNFTDAAVIKQLKDAGLPVFVLTSFNSIKDVENNILLMGSATGDERRAAEIVDQMEAKLAEIAAAVKGVQPKTVMYYTPGSYSDGPGTTIDEMITRAGGINAITAGGIKDPYPQLSDEFVIKQDPDYIMLAGFNAYAPGFVDQFMKNPSFQTLKAIKNKHVVVDNDAHITSVSQYIVEGVADIAALLYPEAYHPAQATMEATMLATAGK